MTETLLTHKKCSDDLRRAQPGDRLRQALFDGLEIIRVYPKPPGKEPDLAAPFLRKRGGTIEDLAGKIHRDLQRNLRSARVCGKDVTDGQPVGRDYVLNDGDIMELRA